MLAVKDIQGIHRDAVACYGDSPVFDGKSARQDSNLRPEGYHSARSIRLSYGRIRWGWIGFADLAPSFSRPMRVLRLSQIRGATY